ncbi:uncharacterized protein [Lolium perenne]|jgi:hypothetical protein|uniref:uncharacterized protein n=1 Tax=Lolium perenne TaxID=4522 RepID=UPI0021EABB0B|nr:uncharacterized protein LOC127335573 [Lolium perenne]
MSLSEKLEAARVALGKRKERELQAQLQQMGPTPSPAAATAKAKAELSSKPLGGGNGNKLLAGNLAHEFLTRGTVLGRRVEPAPAAPGRRIEPAWQPARPEPEPKRRYAEVSWLLMANGAHIPGVVNPTQLAHWLQIKD